MEIHARGHVIRDHVAVIHVEDRQLEHVILAVIISDFTISDSIIIGMKVDPDTEMSVLGT